jgi:hypothetical protein
MKQFDRRLAIDPTLLHGSHYYRLLAFAQLAHEALAKEVLTVVKF